MDELSLNDLKRIEPQIKLLTNALASVNRSMAKTFEMDALHLELARRTTQSGFPSGMTNQEEWRTRSSEMSECAVE